MCGILKSLWCVGAVCACFVGIMWGEHRLIMAVSENVGAMNPQGYRGNAMFAQNSIYEGLVRVDKNGKIVPSLATSWSISEDGLRYTFYLRKGVQFSNGEAFNAKAAVINFQSILKNRARHSWSALVANLADVQIVDEYTILLILKKPYSPALNELATPRPFRFLAPSAFPKDLDLLKTNPKPIGTGVYMLVDSKLGISDTLRKNPHYWDKAVNDKLYYDEVVLKVIFDANAKIAALRSGQIDLIYGYDQIPIAIFNNLHEKSKEFATYLSPPLYSVSLVLNSASPNLTGKNEQESKQLRTFIAQSIDKVQLIKAVYAQTQEVADCLLACHSKEAVRMEPLTPNIESSPNKPHLAHIPTKSIEILFSGDNPAHKMMAEIIQNDLKNVGISVRLSASEPTIYRNRLINGAFDMAFGETWGAPYEPLSVLHSMLIPSHIDFSAQKGLSAKPHIDERIKHLISLSPTSPIFYKTLQEVMGLLYDSGVYVPLTYQRNKAIAHKKIKGIQMGVVGYEVPFWEMYE